MVYGASDDDGMTVKEGKVGAAEVFATILQAVGLDHQQHYQVGSRPVPFTDIGTKPIKEVLA
jgi:hypothetical protein